MFNSEVECLPSFWDSTSATGSPPSEYPLGHFYGGLPYTFTCLPNYLDVTQNSATPTYTCMGTSAIGSWAPGTFVPCTSEWISFNWEFYFQVIVDPFRYVPGYPGNRKWNCCERYVQQHSSEAYCRHHCHIHMCCRLLCQRLKHYQLSQRWHLVKSISRVPECVLCAN